jgi:DNA segregation ATPase FtsK/SpoIIIE-like protein
MEWTMDEFFAGGGTTTFVDRLTASLGIHASQVKIVSVYEGSLVVNYEVEPEEGQSLEELEET